MTQQYELRYDSQDDGGALDEVVVHNPKINSKNGKSHIHYTAEVEGGEHGPNQSKSLPTISEMSGLIDFDAHLPVDDSSHE